MSPVDGAVSRQSRAASPPPRNATVGKAGLDDVAGKENVQANLKAQGVKEAAKPEQTKVAAQSRTSIKSRLAALPGRCVAMALGASLLAVLVVAAAMYTPLLPSSMLQDSMDAVARHPSAVAAGAAAVAASMLGSVGFLTWKRLAKRTRAAKADGKAA
mmetsp:Transcript_117807/g.345106  ORF Transcript_117807/g.345106 Transcript_117807/m.345106 type:complete len:158 (+) Transcript_117807:96-569(+)